MNRRLACGLRLAAVAGLLALALPAQGAIVMRSLTYTDGATEMQGYLAYDDSLPAPLPGILVVHEWWGLNDYIKGRANELARLGYAALAADVYGGGQTTTDPKVAGEWAEAVRSDPALWRKRAGAALDALAAQEPVDRNRLAAIGFCFGGSTVLQLAYSGADLAGVVSFHGGMPIPDAADQARIKPQILVLHGAADPTVSRATIGQFQDALTQANTVWQLVVFSGAKHAFTNPAADQLGLDSIGYDERAARRSWKCMRDFFQELFRKPEFTNSGPAN